ncbi:MAG: cytochrome P450 [Ilumatobacter sp.]|jgi:cytochrome P450
MADITDIDLETYDPMDREVQQCPFDHYAALRDHGPIFHHKQTGMYFASRHDIVNEILRDTETFSSRLANAGTRGGSEVSRQVAEIRREGWPNVDTMLTLDPPHHTRYRKLVARAFSARRIAALEDKVREIAVELIDAFPAKGPVDFHTEFAVLFPVRVIHFALNMSPDAEDNIRRWSQDAIAALGVRLSDERRLDVARSLVENQKYWHGEYEDRLTNPQDDILSDLVHAEFDDPDTPDGVTRQLDFAEVWSIIQQLMVAGNDSTTKFMKEAMRTVIENPEWWHAMKQDPDATIPALVEEGLRIASPNQGLFRVATRDTKIGEVDIPEGSRIWVMFGSANRDETVFENADVFDPDRENVKDHLTFGKGHHFCPGAPLTRLEGRVAFEELVKRIQLPSFSEGNTFEYEPSFVLRGLTGLDLDIEKC